MTSRTGKSPARSAEPSRLRAFTLIELILVMAMLVILISVLAPSLANFFRGRTLDSEARRLMTLIHYGQSRAVSEGSPMVLWLDPQQRAYGLVEESSYTTMDPHSVAYSMVPDVVLEVDQSPIRSAPVSSALTSSQNLRPGRNASAIRFQPDGFIAESSPVLIRLRERDPAGAAANPRSSTLWLTPSLNRLTYELGTNTSGFSRR